MPNYASDDVFESDCGCVRKCISNTRATIQNTSPKMTMIHTISLKLTVFSSDIIREDCAERYASEKFEPFAQFSLH